MILINGLRQPLFVKKNGRVLPVIAYRTALLVALSASSLSVAATSLANGEKCSETTPSSTTEAHARCQSNRCYPGPNAAKQNAPWYCVPAESNCAFPGSKNGAMDYQGGGPQVCINHVAYACMDTGSGLAKHFAPVGATAQACNLPDRQGQATCSHSGAKCSFVGKSCDSMRDAQDICTATTLHSFQLPEKIP